MKKHLLIHAEGADNNWSIPPGTPIAQDVILLKHQPTSLYLEYQNCKLPSRNSQVKAGFYLL